MLVVGITFAAAYGQPVLSQTHQTSCVDQMSLEANTYSMSDSMKMDVARDTTALENMRTDMIRDSMGMEKGHMQMMRDSLPMKQSEMMHDTAVVKEYQMKNDHMYKEMDAKRDTTKIR